LTGTVHPQPSEKIMRRLAKGSAEKTMEMKLGKTSFPRRLFE